MPPWKQHVLELQFNTIFNRLVIFIYLILVIINQPEALGVETTQLYFQILIKDY